MHSSIKNCLLVPRTLYVVPALGTVHLPHSQYTYFKKPWGSIHQLILNPTCVSNLILMSDTQLTYILKHLQDCAEDLVTN